MSARRSSNSDTVTGLVMPGEPNPGGLAVILFLAIVSGALFALWLSVGDPGVHDDDEQEWDTIEYPETKP